MAMAVLTPEGTTDTCMALNELLMTKNFVQQILTHAKCFSMVVR